MKKQTTLILEMAIFFLFVFVSLGMIVLHEKGNILLYPLIEKKLNNYFLKHYQEIKNEVTPQELTFSWKDKSYQLIYQNKKKKDFYFKLTYTKEKKIQSTYQQDYVEGKSLLDKKASSLEKELQKILMKEEFSTIKVEPSKTLKELTQKEKTRLLQGGKEKEIPFYQISLTKSLTSLNAIEMEQVLQEIDETLKEKKWNPLYYQAKFVLSTDGTKTILLKKITRETLKNENFANQINQSYQNNQTKEEKIEMEEF